MESFNLRKSLEDLIRNSVSLKFTLPNLGAGITVSQVNQGKFDDYCYEGASDSSVSKIIYNGIVEFANNEFKIDYEDIEKEQLKTIQRKIKYNRNDKQSEKLKYGFYGEVLLDLFLRVFFNTEVFVARGYFYSPIENSEAKGFDAFHLIEHNNALELWFGEAKFYQSFYSGIKSVLNKLNTSLSDDYLNKNIFTIINERENMTSTSPKAKAILDKIDDNPEIVIADELIANDVELVYPIMVAYQKKSSHSYEESIRDCVNKISDILSQQTSNFSMSIKVSIFVILLPVNNSNKVKEDVIEWIEQKKPLI